MDLDTAPELKSIYNKYRFQWRELKKELEELEDISAIAWAQFYSEFLIQIKKQNIENPFLEQSIEEKKSSKIFEQEELKELYREAAKKTHPDKNGADKIDVFKKISKAKKDGELNQFLEEVKKINQNEVKVSYSLVDELKKEINFVKNKIKNILNSCFMEWYYAENSKKQTIMKRIIKHYDKKKK